MDAALLNLIVTLIVLFATFLFRKRILAVIGRVFAQHAIAWARTTFLIEEASEDAEGHKVVKIGLSGPAKAILASLTPVLMAEVVKGIKVKPGALPTSLPPGLDLSNLSEALPAILPMLPKKWQGIAALAAPLLQGFMKGEGQGLSAEGRSPTKNPFLKEITP